jgi:RimJ/RimL family protein N-acetyltransferase
MMWLGTLNNVLQRPDMNEFSQKMISFETLTAFDMGMLHNWFHVPHVKKWYVREVDYSLKDIKDKYLPRLNDKCIDSYISLINREPMGYIQIYYLPKYLPDNLTQDIIDRNNPINANKTVGLDVFFAKTEYLGKGISSQLLSKFLATHIADGIDTVIVDPLKVNLKAIAFFERNHFSRIDFKFESDNCYLIKKLT